MGPCRCPPQGPMVPGPFRKSWRSQEPTTEVPRRLPASPGRRPRHAGCSKYSTKSEVAHAAFAEVASRCEEAMKAKLGEVGSETFRAGSLEVYRFIGAKHCGT